MALWPGTLRGIGRADAPCSLGWIRWAAALLAGQQLYTAPAVGYVPDGYPPLHFGVCAVVARVLGQSHLPLRLVSLVSSASGGTRSPGARTSAAGS